MRTAAGSPGARSEDAAAPPGKGAGRRPHQHRIFAINLPAPGNSVRPSALARERLGLRDFDQEEHAALDTQLRIQAGDAASLDELVKRAERWVTGARLHAITQGCSAAINSSSLVHATIGRTSSGLAASFKFTLRVP